ncbi:protein DpdE [Gordonia bronchialis]|uniref:protein DpdE n=1 Tax=Gordonia bronchialis TaxID=2054 RepID=UPI002D1E3CD3|nr:protein DpdE [Gordonia bronchialis]
MMPASHYVGRWLRSASHEAWGLAYCKGARDGSLIFSYVDIPEIAEHILIVSRADVVDRPIPTGTRVWMRGEPYGWHPGVIESATTGQRYRVSLVGHGKRLLLHQDQFKIRWARPLEDPAAAIAHGLAEAPTFYEARSALLAELVRQRRVSRGLSAAIAAPINLFQHQVDTAARVLADPVMRYLLADEVGLGKTIEAGIVIRQLLTEDPTASVLVLCPESLCGQWTTELRDRLGLEVSPRNPKLTVAPQSLVREIAAGQREGLAHYDLVVVDEAHNLFQHLGVEPELEEQFRRVTGLIALSATPMRGDVEIFRRLLALVDPVAFGGTDAQSFRARLDERERSAGDVQVLSTRRASLRQKASVLTAIESDFPNDANVQAFAEACRKTVDPQDPVWVDLAEYVREIYRISRRMIRHRRTVELTQAYNVAGRFPSFIEFEDPARAVVDEFLETYRMRLSDPDPTYAVTVLHGLAGPMALRDHLEGRWGEEDRALFEMTIARLEMAGVDARLTTAAEVVRERIETGNRVVVASSFPDVLRRFEKILQDYVDDGITFFHYLSMTTDNRDAAVTNFLSSDDGAVLVADDSMEEGRNLQEAEVLVNLDLPLDANRLDQRIGRLDRYAVRPEPAEVVVLTEPESPWVSAQIELLQDGIGVFDAAVSTVQRLLSVVLSDVVDHLVEGGADALKVDVAALRDELEVERDSIDLLEELESVESATVFDDEAFDELLTYESDLDGLRGAVRRLTTGAGSVSLQPTESSLGIISFGNARRIGLSSDDAASLERLLRPKAFDREVTLENRGVSPFRIGDPLVDWLHAYLLADERGRASAWARPLAGLRSPALWLHCEFLIEFDSDEAALPDGPDRARLTRRGEAHLQPMRLETWTDAGGPAPQDLVDTVLDLPFDSKRDEILRGQIWDPVLDEIPSWSRLCAESAEAAWEQVRSSPELEESVSTALNRATADSARRIAILEARSVRLSSGPEREAARIELEAERIAAEALLRGITTPSIRLVACGACVLWPEDKFDG